MYIALVCKVYMNAYIVHAAELRGLKRKQSFSNIDEFIENDEKENKQMLY